MEPKNAPSISLSTDLSNSYSPQGFRERFLDRAGLTVATLCTIKCVGLPLLAACLPALDSMTGMNQSPILHSKAMHAALLAIAAPPAMKNLIYNEIVRKRPLMAAVSTAALLMMGFGTVVGHGSHDHHSSHPSAPTSPSQPTSSHDTTPTLTAAQRLRLRAKPGDEICGLPNPVPAESPTAQSTTSEQMSGSANASKIAYAAGGVLLGAGHLRRITRRSKEAHCGPK